MFTRHICKCGVNGRVNGRVIICVCAFACVKLYSYLCLCYVRGRVTVSVRNCVHSAVSFVYCVYYLLQKLK